MAITFVLYLGGIQTHDLFICNVNPVPQNQVEFQALICFLEIVLPIYSNYLLDFL